MTPKAEVKKREIEDALYWDSRIDASKINVTVKYTKATLRGTVYSYLERRIAEDCAYDVLGISSVKNELVIKYSSPNPTDAEIKSNIENTFLWNPALHLYKIDVSVNAGIVTLKGDADAYYKCFHAEELANDIKGVVEVHNELAVVPTETYADARIAKRILKSFEDSILIDSDKVTVKVEYGIVTLTGTLSSWAAKNWATTKAVYTTGVIKVDNLIKVIQGIENESK